METQTQPRPVNPLVARLNKESRAVRQILNVLGKHDRQAKGRIIRTVVELADEQPSNTIFQGANGAQG